MLTSLRRRMSVLLLAFFLLVSISVAATSWMIDTQKNDALVINLAGRQRLLIKQMSHKVLRIAKGEGADGISALREAARTFDRTLVALLHGGVAPYLADYTVYVPATRQADIHAGLQHMHNTWETMRVALELISTRQPGDPAFTAAVQSVERVFPDLLQHADAVVRQYEAAAVRKVTRVWWTQMAFFASALALLAVGILVTQSSVVQPLHLLGSAADRLGQGDLDTPVVVPGPHEIANLSCSVDTMRQRLRASQRELLTWTETLETRVAQRTRELAALHQVSREISSCLNINHVLPSVTDKARELLGGDVAFLCLLDAEGKTLHLRAVSGPHEAVRNQCAPVHQPLLAQVLAQNRALPCGIEHCLGSCGMMAVPFQASHLAAPLQVDERVIGALCVASPRTGLFAAEQAGLLTKLADSAAIALENAHLYEQAERVATLEERQRIAAEMHDGLAQTLSYLGLKAQQVAELVQTGEGTEAMQTLHAMHVGIDQALCDVRRSIASLQENPQPRLALQERLRATVEEVSKDGAFTVELQSQPQTPLDVPPAEAEQVIHIARETLLNACRHARATRIVVRVEQQETEMLMCIEDDGKGFDPQALPAQGETHFGLRVMRARTARIGGQLIIDSTPGHGTRVTLRWPAGEFRTRPTPAAVPNAVSVS
jgi:two-component system nitrate/nitrite sensor histidine kinase NarX